MLIHEAPAGRDPANLERTLHVKTPAAGNPLARPVARHAGNANPTPKSRFEGTAVAEVRDVPCRSTALLTKRLIR
jgi:hypothetical protein